METVMKGFELSVHAMKWPAGQGWMAALQTRDRTVWWDVDDYF